MTDKTGKTDKTEGRVATREELLQREAERRSRSLWRARVRRMSRGARYGYWK